MLEAMDAFAYPIIMGYASETGSFQNVARQYYASSNIIMPDAFQSFKNIGLNAKLLYRLWRIRVEIIIIDEYLEDVKYNGWPPKKQDQYMKQFERSLYYETDITEASIKQYRKKLDKKLKEMQKEIEVFRKNGMQ